MKEPLHIEDLINKKLADAEIGPSESVWNEIRREVRWKQFFRYRTGQWNIYYLGGILVAGAVFSALLLTGSPEREEDVLPVAPQAIQPAEPDSRETGQTGEPRGETAVPADSAALAEEEDPAAAGEPRGRSEAVLSGEALDSSLRRVSPVAGTSQKEPVSEKISLRPVARFTTSLPYGCAPLEVQFFNRSTGGQSYHWSIGEQELTASDPVHTFTEPGKYIVTLKVSGDGLQQSAHQELIEVFPAAGADFEIEEGFTDMEGRASINLVNYSSGASFYRWDILDKNGQPLGSWSSMEFQPHVPLSDLDPGFHAIRLIASSENGCSDTLVKEIPVVVETFDQKLRFPTAFSPNPTGPGGGSFGPNQRRTDIFHPVIHETPATYRLRIFTRRGELVFETRNLYMGWDGYIQQERAAAGVYVWMAEGTWSNGESYSLQGDVTLIWNEIW